MTPEEKKQFELMKTDIEDIKSDVTEIKNALLGNKDYQQEGYIEKVKNLQERLDKIEKLVFGGKWLILGVCLAGGYGLSEIIGHIISYFTK